MKGNEYTSSINLDDKPLYDRYSSLVELNSYITKLRYPSPITEERYNQAIQALNNAGLEPGTAESPDGSFNSAYLLNIVNVTSAALGDAKTSLDNLLKEKEDVTTAISMLENSLVLDNTSDIHFPTISRWADLFMDGGASVNNHTLDWLRTYVYALQDTYPKTKIVTPETTNGITSYWVEYLYNEQLCANKYYENIAYPYIRYAEAISLKNNPTIPPTKFIFATGTIGEAIESMLTDYLALMYHKMQVQNFTKKLKTLPSVAAWTEQDISTYVNLQTNYLNAQVNLVKNNRPAIQTLINGLRCLIPNHDYYNMREYLSGWLEDSEKMLQIEPISELTQTIFNAVNPDLISSLVRSISETEITNRRNFGIYMPKALTSIKTSLPEVSELTDILLDYTHGLTGHAKYRMIEIVDGIFSSENPDLQSQKEAFDSYQQVLKSIEQFVLSDDLSYMEFEYNTITEKLGDNITATISNFENRSEVNTFYNEVIRYLNTLVDEDTDDINVYLKSAITETAQLFDNLIFAGTIMDTLASYEPYSDDDEVINNVNDTIEQLLNHYIEIGIFASLRKEDSFETKEAVALEWFNSFVNSDYISGQDNLRFLNKAGGFAFLPSATEQTYVISPDATGKIEITITKDSLSPNSSFRLYNSNFRLSFSGEERDDKYIITAPAYAGTLYYLSFTANSGGNIFSSFTGVKYKD